MWPDVVVLHSVALNPTRLEGLTSRHKRKVPRLCPGFVLPQAEDV